MRRNRLGLAKEVGHTMTKSVNNTSFLKGFVVCTTVRLFSVTKHNIIR